MSDAPSRPLDGSVDLIQDELFALVASPDDRVKLGELRERMGSPSLEAFEAQCELADSPDEELLAIALERLPPVPPDSLRGLVRWASFRRGFVREVFVDMDDITGPAVSNLFAAFPLLESVIVRRRSEDFRTSPQDWAEAVRLILGEKRATFLKRLAIRGCYRSEWMTECFAEAKGASLRSLSIDAQTPEFLGRLREFPTTRALNELSIGWTEVGGLERLPASITHVTAHVRNQEALLDLPFQQLVGLNIGVGPGPLALAIAKKPLGLLRSLAFWGGTPSPGDSVVHALRESGALAQLRECTFNGFSFSANGIAALTSGLRRCRSLALHGLDRRQVEIVLRSSVLREAELAKLDLRVSKFPFGPRFLERFRPSRILPWLRESYGASLRELLVAEENVARLADVAAEWPRLRVSSRLRRRLEVICTPSYKGWEWSGGE